MQVIRQVLEALYQGEIVRVDSSTDVAPSLPRIVDRALQATPSCAFRTYEQSLVYFARAVYLLRLDDGRCSSPEKPGCGLADPNHLYETPPATVYEIREGATEIDGSIPSSFGIDLGKLVLSPALRGKDLQLLFTSAAASDAKYRLELWRAGVGRPISVQTANGSLTMEVKDLSSADLDGLGLIITRLDPHEDRDNLGAYTIQIVVK
jgi:hypothetical protein